MIYQNNYQKSVEKCASAFETCDDDCNVGIQSSDMYIPHVSPIEKADSCFCRMYDLLLPRLLVKKVKYGNRNIKLIRLAQDSYLLPDVALEKADAFVSYGLIYNYGVLGVVLLEDALPRLYKKDMYAFDCYLDDVKTLIPDNPFLKYEKECLTDKTHVMDNIEHYTYTDKIHDLGQKFKDLNLESKQVFLKVDAAGAEMEIIPQIVANSDNLTGFAIVIRIDNTDRIIKYRELLKDLDKDFVLVARNGIRGESYNGCKCRFMKHEFSNAIALSYINKKYANKVYLPIKQDYHDTDNYITIDGIYPTIPPYTIGWEVVVTEKIKSIFGRN